jgi:hypothetical protein
LLRQFVTTSSKLQALGKSSSHVLDEKICRAILTWTNINVRKIQALGDNPHPIYG